MLGLFKSGKLRLRHTTDRADLIKLLGYWHEKFDLVTKKYFSTEPRNPSLRDRSGLPDDISSQEEARPQNFAIGNDDPELELCEKSRSFLNRVNEQMRKRQKNVNVTRDGRRTLYDWEIYGCDNGISSICGKELPNNRNSIANTTDLTLKQIFDISTRLVSEQDEISGLEAFGWENHSWKYLSSIGDERIINLQRTKIYVFSDSVLCLGKIQQKNGSKSMGAKIWMDQIFSKLQRL